MTYQHAFKWARAVKLDPNPELPSRLRHRAADNWRVLISIADSFGPLWGAAARNAALSLLDGNSDEDAGVTLLTDIRGVFDRLHLDRIPSAELVRHLCELEDGELPQLSAGRLASMLKPFGIRSKSIWPLGPRDGAKYKSQKGYLRSSFEAAWSRYCPKAGTPAQASKIKQLL